MKLLLTALVTLGTISSAYAESKLVKHNLFGKVPRAQAHLFKQFEPYLEKAMELSAQLGVRELPVKFASFKQNTSAFSDQNSMPHFLPTAQKLLLGSVVDQQKLHKEEITIALHELFHAVHTQYIMQAHGIEFVGNLLDAHRVAFFSTWETREFFADLLTTFVLDDASAINRGLDFYSEKNLGRDLSKKPAHVKAGDDLRDFNYNKTEGEHSCSAISPASAHHYYSVLRKYVWNDLYKKQFNSEKSSIPEIINAVAEVGIEIGQQDEELFNKTHHPDLSVQSTMMFLTGPQTLNILDTREYFIEHKSYDHQYIYAVNEKIKIKAM